MSSSREKLVAIEGLHKDLLNLQTAHQHKFNLDLSDTFPEMDIPQHKYFDDDILMLNRPIATVRMSRPTNKVVYKNGQYITQVRINTKFSFMFR
jgi:hypothetical protein